MKNNSIALVTGASSGFGKGIASELVKSGVKVFITGRNAGKLARWQLQFNLIEELKSVIISY
jgi:NADP-dependent 3-hydroxy acid dehydrogenase YdfG